MHDRSGLLLFNCSALTPSTPYNFSALLQATIDTASYESLADEGSDCKGVDKVTDCRNSTTTVVLEESPSIPCPATKLTLCPAMKSTPVPFALEPNSQQQTWNKSNSKRAKKWQADIAAGLSTPRTLSHVLSHGTCVEVDLDASQFNSAKGAHTEKPGTAAKLGSQTEIHKEVSVQQLVKLEFEHINWVGITPIPVVDRSGRIIAVFAGQPTSDYAKELLEAFNLFIDAGDKAGL
ncbi:hypothetical protein C8R42DRAFT_729724 [Lentinula raphanica]|nr:hypothetical protein C8R42DRAFT_729724 [Lentinula raphanica]